MPSQNLQDHVLTINGIERLKNSRNGNPRFRLSFTNGRHALTSTDAAVGYEIGNPGLREGCKVIVSFTKAGRVAYMNAVQS